MIEEHQKKNIDQYEGLADYTVNNKKIKIKITKKSFTNVCFWSILKCVSDKINIFKSAWLTIIISNPKKRAQYYFKNILKLFKTCYRNDL